MTEYWHGFLVGLPIGLGVASFVFTWLSNREFNQMVEVLDKRTELLEELHESSKRHPLVVNCTIHDLTGEDEHA